MVKDAFISCSVNIKRNDKVKYVLEKTQQLIISHEEHNHYFYNHIWPEKPYAQQFPHN
jgi:hypothetical protein